MPSTSPQDGPPAPFKDAEAWLAARGIERERIEIPLEPSPPEPGPGATGLSDPGLTDPGSDDPVSEIEREVGMDAAATSAAPGAFEPGLSARDAGRLANQAIADAQLRAGDAAATPAAAASGLEDDVAEAVAFVRRSTSMAPQAEGRVRAKLEERGWSAAVIDATLERSRRERLVDDPAMAAALVAERRAKGHAVARIRRDLRERGFDDVVLRVALGAAEDEDPEAAAFAVARDKAEGLTALTAEKAFRRVVGHVTRRGYPEGLARKVAREAVFTARDAERVAGH